jgi:CDP-paratose 2-epimerase
MSNGHVSNNGHGRAESTPQVGKLGILEWFHVGDEAAVERTVAALEELKITRLRTGVSWADCNTEEGLRWYDWLLPKLAKSCEVLPCFLYTPPSLGIAPKTSSPPREPKAYADFLHCSLERWGNCFEYVELWNEPNNQVEWDWTLDPTWMTFSEMIGAAAYWTRKQGCKTVLGGMSPADPGWLSMMFERGVMEFIDVVGVHGFPGGWDYGWEGWNATIGKVRSVLDAHKSPAEIWITESGYSTWRHDEFKQVQAFADLLEAPVARAYWYGLSDLHPARGSVAGFHVDERDYHFGLLRHTGAPKLLYRLLAQGGMDAVRELNSIAPERNAHVGSEAERPVMITGGAGFVGTNLADRLLRQGKSVRIFDNLSRPGVEENLRWLQQTHGGGAGVIIADVRDQFAIRDGVLDASAVYHLAAQVAVTTSLVDPVTDFEINARGTVNLLEAMRALENPPPLLFTSTNKVYGGLEDVEMAERDTRYEPADLITRSKGISELRPLDFHSPYGCSKGAADQYVIDYARTMGLQAIVFRMSCIYGPHQFGNEDQGWVAHFLIKALRGETITLFGDGKQVRDILFVEDLVDAFLAAMDRIDTVSGQAFNIGGGPQNTTSLLELLDLIESVTGEAPKVQFQGWRPGDQRYYVSDTAKIETTTGWHPRTNVREGVQALHDWLVEFSPLIKGRNSGAVVR